MIILLGVVLLVFGTIAFFLFWRGD